MRQVDLQPGDVILYKDGAAHLVVGRDTDEGGSQGGREYIRYLNLRSGASSPWLAMIRMLPVKGEVIRGRETVWVSVEMDGLDPDFMHHV